MSEAVAAPAPAAPPASKKREGLLARFSDRCNPILVREVHQALNGKGFLFTAALALLATVVIALYVAAAETVSPREGAEVFQTTFAVLAPILLFIVPFQAFLSMRSEVGGGTVEHLLMSRLSPGAIVRGKLLSTTVQFGMYLAIFSPLIGMTFLLRGVDVPTIAVMLTLAFAFALTASSLAIMCGALCRWRSFFRVVPFAIVIGGLGWLAGAAIVGIDDVVRSTRRSLADEHFGHYFTTMLMPLLVCIVLFSMVGSAALSHPYENRSTKFRIFAVGFMLLVFGWVIYWYESAASAGMRRYIDLGDQLAGSSMVSAIVLCLFPFLAATEEGKLSPRARLRVPRNGLLAFFATPFLPGGGRGLVFAILLGGIALFGPWVLALLWDQDTPGHTAGRALRVAWYYIVFFAALGGFVRARLGPGEARNWYARGVLPGALFLGVLLPLIVGAAGGSSVMRGWSPLQLFNPFMTLAHLGYGWGSSNIEGWVFGMTLVVVVLNIPSIGRGIAEVQTASFERRREGERRAS